MQNVQCSEHLIFFRINKNFDFIALNTNIVYINKCMMMYCIWKNHRALSCGAASLSTPRRPLLWSHDLFTRTLHVITRLHGHRERNTVNTNNLHISDLYCWCFTLCGFVGQQPVLAFIKSLFYLLFGSYCLVSYAPTCFMHEQHILECYRSDGEKYRKPR